jgi:L-2-hydroxyglutarate oxidase LhgO
LLLLALVAAAAGAVVTLRSAVVGGAVLPRGGGIRLDVADSAAASSSSSPSSSSHAVTAVTTRIRARAVVNAAGLHAQGVALRLVGVPPASVPRLHLARGCYFSLAPHAASPAPLFSRLVYPLPQEGGLGIHATVDLAGRVRFGPDVEWLPDAAAAAVTASPGAASVLDYAVDPSRAAAFEAAVRDYLPDLPPGALLPDYAGIRPKLTGRGEPGADFCVAGAAAHGVNGLVCLYGIESPGLTACLALARHAAAQLRP